MADQITHEAGDMSKRLAELNTRSDEIQRDYIDKYSPYRKYVSKTAAAILLVVSKVWCKKLKH